MAIVSLTPANVDRAAEEITLAGGRAISIPCEVTDLDHMPVVVQQVLEAFDRLDILVNNAMEFLSVIGNVLDISRSQAERQFLGGPLATLTFMQACHPDLAQKGGRVINLGSSAVVMGAPGLGAYAMAKEAVRALSRSAACEWGPDGITVNCICPIAMTDSYAQAEATGELSTVVDTALGRAGSPDEDIAPVALFLASYLTGYTMMADGGFIIDAARCAKDGAMISPKLHER